MVIFVYIMDGSKTALNNESAVPHGLELFAVSGFIPSHGRQKFSASTTKPLSFVQTTVWGI